jgi:PAS domain S-box-containing protein
MASKRILLLESEQAEAQKVSQLLTAPDYEIVGTARTGEEALDQCVKLKPDLVLMDVILPGKLDGIQTAERLREMNVGVVYVSAHSDQSLVERALRTKPLAFLTKPVRPPDLAAAIQLGISRREREDPAGRATRQMVGLEAIEPPSAGLPSDSHAIFMLDNMGLVTSWNPTAERSLGYKAEEIIGQPFGILFPPEDRDLKIPEKELERARREGWASDSRWMVRKSGERYLAEGILSAIRDSAGAITGFAKVTRDTTREREMQKALRDSRQRLRVALNAARMGTWYWDVRSDTDILDESLRGLLGLRPNEEVRHIEDFYRLIHPVDRPKVRESFERTRTEGVHLNTEFRVEQPDGSERWLLDQGEVAYDETGSPAYLTGACVDITERKLAEEALLQSEERFRLFVNNVRDYALFQMDRDGIVVSWNPGAERMLGYTEAEIIGKSCQIVFTPEDQAQGEFLKELRDSAATGRGQDERWHVRKDGTRFWASGVLAAVRDDHGDLRGFAKVMRDETERRQASERLKASLGEKDVLLKEIHHRVKNNLQVISSLLTLQSERVQDNATREMFEDACNRVRAIGEIHQLLYQSPDLGRVDFGAYLQTLSRSLFAFYGVDPSRVVLLTENHSEGLQIGQAIPCGLIVNELLTNSLKHAFPAGRKGSVKASLDCTGDGECVLAVLDDGVGMPEGVSGSHSLGLQLVSVLAKQLQGQVRMESLNPGTRVEIRFPYLRRPGS